MKFLAPPTNNKKTRYTLGFLAIVLFFLGASAFFISTRFLLPVEKDGIDDLTFYLWAVGLLLLSVGVYCFYRKHCYQVIRSWPYVVVLSVFLTIAVLSILLFTSYSERGDEYIASWPMKIRMVVHVILSFLTIFNFVVICPSLSRGARVYNVLYFVISIVVLISVIYSYVAEWGMYTALFSGDSELVHAPQCRSFTSNRNIYGFLLFVGMASEMFLMFSDRRFYHWFFVFLYYSNIVFAGSKTCLVIGLFMLSAFTIYFFVILVRRHWVKASIPLAVLLLLHAFVIFFLFVDFGAPFNKLHIFFSEAFLEGKEMGLNSFPARFEHIETAFSLVSTSPRTLWMGFGNINGTAVYFFHRGDVSKQFALDATIALTLLEGGITGLVFSVIAWIYLLVIIILSFIRKDKKAMLYLLFYISSLTRSFMEITDLTYLNWSSMALYGMVLIPALSSLRHQKVMSIHPESNAICVDLDGQKTQKQCKTPTNISTILVFTFPIFVSLLSVFPFVYSLTNNEFFNDFWNMSALFILYCSVTLSLYFCLFYRRDKSPFRYVVFLVYSLVDIILVTVGLIFAPGEGALWFAIGGIVLLVVLAGSAHVLEALRKQWSYALYFFLWSAFFVCGFYAIGHFFCNSINVYSVLGVIAIVMIFTMFHSYFLDFWCFPIFGGLFDYLDAHLLPWVDKVASLRYIRKMR